MPTNVPVIIAAICSIPRKFRRGHSSPNDLVAESGFQTVRDTLTAEELEACLARDPTLIEDWEGWSDDKRVSEGWYFRRVHGGGTVGYFSKDSHIPTMVYRSDIEACAHFILNEVRHIDQLKNRVPSGKDDSILVMLSVLYSAFGTTAFEIADNWDADTMALGIHRVDEPNRIVYISTFNQPPDRYFVSLEGPTKVDIDLSNIDAAGLITAVENHLTLKRLT